MSTRQREEETVQELDLEKYLGIDRMREDREKEARAATGIEKEILALEMIGTVEEEEEVATEEEVLALDIIVEGTEEKGMRGKAKILAMGTDEKSAQRPLVMGGLL